MDINQKWTDLIEYVESSKRVCKKDMEDADVRYAGFLHGMINAFDGVLGKIRKLINT